RSARAARSLPSWIHRSAASGSGTPSPSTGACVHPARPSSQAPTASAGGRSRPASLSGLASAVSPVRSGLAPRRTPRSTPKPRKDPAVPCGYDAEPVPSAGPTTTSRSGRAAASTPSASAQAARAASSSGAAPAATSGTSSGGQGQTAAATSMIGSVARAPAPRPTARPHLPRWPGAGVSTHAPGPAGRGEPPPRGRSGSRRTRGAATAMASVPGPERRPSVEAAAAGSGRERLGDADLRQAEHDARGLGGLLRGAPLPGVARAGAPDVQDGALREEVVGGGVGDLDGHHITGSHLLVRLGEVHQAVVRGSAGQAVGGVVLAALALRDHQLHGPADLLLVLLPGDLLLEGDQPLVALLDDLLGDLAVHLGGRGARPLGVLEGERLGEARLAHH